jgi:hypothetical protein
MPCIFTLLLTLFKAALVHFTNFIGTPISDIVTYNCSLITLSNADLKFTNKWRAVMFCSFILSNTYANNYKLDKSHNVSLEIDGTTAQNRVR